MQTADRIAVATGRLFILSAPSGTGKTTISSRLQQDGVARISVSHTTRPPRPTEKEGVAYFFVSREQFQALLNDGGFLEWAEVYGHLYGTSTAWVDAQLSAGHNVILEIDGQGARQVKKKRPHVTSIFIMPPSMDVLRARLIARHEDSADVMQTRLRAAEVEIQEKNKFDHVIINEQLDVAVRQVASIITHPHGEKNNGKNNR